MGRMTIFAIAAVLLALTAAPAFAATTDSVAPSTPSQTGITPPAAQSPNGITPPSADSQYGPRAQPDNPAAAVPDDRDTRELVGRVVSVDAARGLVVIDTEEGIMPLRVSDGDARSVQPGDLVAVRIPVEESTPSGSPREE